MGLVIPNEGEAEMIRRLLNASPPDDLILRLYENNISPTESDIVSTYTECSAGGYSPASLSGASWSVNTDGNGITSATYPQQDFNLTSSITIYGYFITNNSGTTLMWAKDFSSPQIIETSGTVSVTPYIELD